MFTKFHVAIFILKVKFNIFINSIYLIPVFSLLNFFYFNKDNKISDINN